VDRAAPETYETDVPARLDRLPWSRFHWLVVSALGITWILDGLEVTLVGSLSGAIVESPALRMSSTGIGANVPAYRAATSAHRPARAQETVHDHRAGLSGGDHLFRAGVGFLVVRDLPRHHRRRHRRRVCRRQCDHPGTDTGTPARLH
jgi:2-methylcitrate dehydratase PrpD